MSVIEKVNTKVARKLRNLRENSGKTQKELADIMDLSVSAISMYENGGRIPSDKVKKQYALLFDVSIEDIFFWFKSTRNVHLQNKSSHKED